MKKKVLLGLLIIFSSILLVGCTNKEEQTKPFTMECTTKEEKTKEYTAKTTVTYIFNEEQLNTEYKSVTSIKFKSTKAYEKYKSEKEELFNTNDSNNVSYILEPKDEKETYKFTMEVREIDKSIESKEDLNNIKASTILKRNEKSGATCKIEGINKNKIKN